MINKESNAAKLEQLYKARADFENYIRFRVRSIDTEFDRAEWRGTIERLNSALEGADRMCEDMSQAFEKIGEKDSERFEVACDGIIDFFKQFKELTDNLFEELR